ncbi:MULTISPECIES: RloB family protein [unclassified Streptomyces]|uniref:RloB family protein n=1 Tax=unclassified Streptomyces TaxID=2593676 RepID=UPI0036E84E7D
MGVDVKRGKPLRRTKGARPEQRRFLVHCEGERTEDQYFKGLRTELRTLPVAICLGGEHGEPKSLVKAAIEHKKRALRSASDRWMEYDEVWCVIDVEAPVPHEGLADALKLAGQHGIEVALTNPCFELWLLLHFKDVSADVHVGRRARRPTHKKRSRDSTPAATPSVASTWRTRVCATDTTGPRSARGCCGGRGRRDTRTIRGRTWTGWSGC